MMCLVTGSSFYFRWGRSECPDTSTKIFSGQMTAPNMEATGGGVNYQCLHREPEYNAYSTGSSYSVISGVEFQASDDGIFPNAAHDKNVPCARCYTQRSATVMIPSRRSCPSGWSKEYEGME